MQNAAYYTQEGRISLDFKKRGAHTHQFIVTDTGTGIPTEQQEMLFKPFTEVKDLTQGDGLGLPICSLIATKMNGSLTLDTSYTKAVSYTHLDVYKRQAYFHSHYSFINRLLIIQTHTTKIPSVSYTHLEYSVHKTLKTSP